MEDSSLSSLPSCPCTCSECSLVRLDPDVAELWCSYYTGVNKETEIAVLVPYWHSCRFAQKRTNHEVQLERMTAEFSQKVNEYWYNLSFNDDVN